MRRAIALTLLAVAGLGTAGWLLQRRPGPRLAAPARPAGGGPPADVAVDTAAPSASAGRAAGDAAAATASLARELAEAAPPPDADAAAALLDRAATDRSLTLLTAEVLAVGPVLRASADGLLHQQLKLRVRSDVRDGIVWRYQVLDAPLCPATSEALHGCRTEFGVVQPGQVRVFVLGRGRPDLGALSGLLEAVGRWVVLAGPEVSPPPDPVLAAVPAELASWLGRPRCNVFRGRIVEVRTGVAGHAPDAADGRQAAANANSAATPRRGLRDQFGHVVVEVLESARLAGPVPLPRRVRMLQQPFVSGDDLQHFTVGGEHWFATDDAALWQVLRASAPARR